MKKIYFLITFVLMYGTIVYAWNDTDTHPRMNEVAVANSRIGQQEDYLKKVLKLSDGIKTTVDGSGKFSVFGGYFKTETKTVLDWLKYGGTWEDKETLCRASNHFHNPLKPWDVAGLSGFGDTWPQWLYCTFASPIKYPAWYMQSALTWATGFAPPGGTDENAGNRNSWDWESARNYYFQYLAGYDQVWGNDNTLIVGKRANEICLGRCFRALGQVMHLLQDVSVPAHVRNDFSNEHLEYVPDSIPLNIRKIIFKGTNRFGSLFETFVWNYTSEDPYIWFKTGSNKMNLTNKPITDLWDTVYDGTEDSINMKEHIGLAEYTNQNFFSKASVFKYSFFLGTPTVDDEFPFPNEDRLEPDLKTYTEFPYVTTDYTPEGELIYSYTIGSTTSHGEKINHLVRPSFWTEIVKTKRQEVEDEEGQDVYRRSFRLDIECFKDYAPLLIPRAIDYSADLLDYFFRGRLEITEAAPVLRNHSIKYMKVDVKNITPTKEALTEGEFTVSCRYTPEGKNPDGSEDQFAHSNSYSCQSLEHDQELKWMFFTFIDPIPEDATIKKITLAYKGKLGEEKNAVIGAVETFDNGATEYRFGETIFGEEWDDEGNSLTGNHPWEKIMSADIGGTAYTNIESGILKQSNKRDAGSEEGRHNVTQLKFEKPIHIGKNAFLHFKFNEMRETPNGGTDYSQYLWLIFSNNTSLMFTYDGGLIYAHSGAAYYKFAPGYIVTGNIYDLIKTTIKPDEFFLTDILLAQEMFGFNTPEDTQYEEYLESDFISIVEGIHK